MAKNSGKVFEEAIKKSIEKVPQCYYYRLRDPASSFNQTDNLRFSIQNDYDCLMYKYPHFFPLELKSTKGTSFSIQFEKKEKSKMIKLNQINGLTKASEVNGVFAGFLFNFSEKATTYWMDIRDFNKFKNSTTKKSINESDIIEYNGIKVSQQLKKVNYSYDMDELIQAIFKRAIDTEE